MRSILPFYFALLVLVAACSAPSEDGPRAILVTLDGLRWEEVYTGADSLLLFDERYTDDMDRVAAAFWDPEPAVRRQLLMPWVWSTVESDGRLYGNRNEGSMGEIMNGRILSYPGYNEILTGHADDRIDSNDKIANENVTVLEWVNRQDGFSGKVAAFASWDVFPFIINHERSGVPVNAGFMSPEGSELSDRELFLTELQAQTPSPWSTVRLDVFTHHFAREYLSRKQPTLTYIGYGETDDFAHDGSYDAYLRSTIRTDVFLADLWSWVQSTDGYRDNTTLIVTTDHGRGAGDRWVGHGSDWVGSDAIWMFALGPNVDGSGQVAASFRQDQVAATVAAAIGLDYSTGRDVGEAIDLSR